MLRYTFLMAVRECGSKSHQLAKQCMLVTVGSTKFGCLRWDLFLVCHGQKRTQALQPPLTMPHSDIFLFSVTNGTQPMLWAGKTEVENSRRDTSTLQAVWRSGSMWLIVTWSFFYDVFTVQHSLIWSVSGNLDCQLPILCQCWLLLDKAQKYIVCW